MERFLPLGIIVDGLSALPQLVDAFLDHPYVATADTAVTAPLFKVTPEIAAAHKAARSARDRLQMYLKRGVLDEEVRVQVSQRFVSDYRKRFGRSERRDVFLASANIVRIAVTLKSLRALDPMIRSAVAKIIWSEPHDSTALERELAAAGDVVPQGGAVQASESSYYAVELKLFLDNILNPARLKDPHVLEAVQTSGFANPVVLEFWTSPALPGYAWAVIGELADAINGVPVWMEVSEALR